MGDPLFFVKITDTLFGNYNGKPIKSVYHVNCHDITKVYRKDNKHYVRLYTDNANDVVCIEHQITKKDYERLVKL